MFGLFFLRAVAVSPCAVRVRGERRAAAGNLPGQQFPVDAFHRKAGVFRAAHRAFGKAETGLQQDVVDDDVAGFIPEARIAMLPPGMMPAGQMQCFMRQSAHQFFLGDTGGKGRVIAQRRAVRPELAAGFVRFRA